MPQNADRHAVTPRRGAAEPRRGAAETRRGAAEPRRGTANPAALRPARAAGPQARAAVAGTPQGTAPRSAETTGSPSAGTIRLPSWIER